MAERTVTIRDSKALCKTLGARGVIVIAVHGQQLSATSYGTTKDDCREIGKHLDRAYDAIMKRRGPGTETALQRAARHVLAQLDNVGWPEDKELAEELREALGAAEIGHA